MEGISKQYLKNSLVSINNAPIDDAIKSAFAILVEKLIAECQELQEPWMTLDEFLKSGFIGKCWVNIAFTSDFADFNGIDFIENPCIESKFPVKHIARVMPIHKPEPPR